MRLRIAEDRSDRVYIEGQNREQWEIGPQLT